jgi:hypothetical protein
VGFAAPDREAERLAALVLDHLRPFVGYGTDEATGEPLFEFDPPLTAAELVVFGRLARLAKSRVLALSPAEWASLDADDVLARLRTARTRTDAEWSALTAVQRDAALIDAVRAMIDLLRLVVRN